MALTNSFVHEIDISRWLLGSEMRRAEVVAGPGGEPLMITMTTDRDEIVSTEVFVNAAYGYHVHAELVGQVAEALMHGGQHARPRHLEMHAQEEASGFLVAVLLRVEDVAALAEQQARDAVDDAGAVRAGQGEDVFMAHGWPC